MRTIEYNCSFFLLPKVMNQKSGKSACCILTSAVADKAGLKDSRIGRDCCRFYKATAAILNEKIKKDGNHVHNMGYCNTPCKDPESYWLYSFPISEGWGKNSMPELVKQSCEEIMKAADKKGLETVYLPELDKKARKIAEGILDDRFVMCVPSDKEGHDEKA